MAQMYMTYFEVEVGTHNTIMCLQFLENIYYRIYR